MTGTPTTDGGSAETLIDKLRDFASSLDSTERELLAALLAPGINAAWQDDDEVTGFTVDWSAGRLPGHLGDVIRSRELRIEGW